MLRKVACAVVVVLGLMLGFAGSTAAKKTLLVSEETVFLGSVEGWNHFAGTAVAESNDGIRVEGNLDAFVRALAVSGDTAILEILFTVTAPDGQSVTLDVLGPFSIRTQKFTCTGSVVAATGKDYERLIGNDVDHSGQVFHPAGFYVIGQTYVLANTSIEKHDYKE